MARANPIDIQKHLKEMDYPASKEDLINHAQEHGADENICAVLNELPEEEYHSAADVSKAIGKVE